MTAPILETPRLRLHPFAHGDVDVLHAQWTDPDVRRYLWDGRVIGRDEVAAVVDESIATFESQGIGFWTVAVRTAPDVVGFAGLRTMPDSSDVELYYGLLPGSWGRGFATEASIVVVRHGFDVAGLPAIWVRTDGPNLASVAVMKRLGARYARTDPIGAFGSTVVYLLAPGS